MDFDFTTTFTRQRASQKVDPYNPDEVTSDWGNPDEVEVSGYWASQSSLEQSDAVRSQIVTTKQLVLDDPDADIQLGDRIKTAAGDVYRVTGIPEADVNPFTGWQPTRVVNLEYGVG
jgi:hypothetical protein